MNSDFNEKNLIKVRQVCFIYLAFVPVNKLVSLPATLAALAQEQFIVSLLANIIVDGLILWLILFLNEKRQDQTLYNTLEKGLGKVAAKIIYTLLAAYFLIKSIVPLFEHKAYVESTLYEMMPHGVIFFTFFVFSTYLCLKGLKTLGRCADIAVWLTAAGLIVGLFLSVGYADYSNMRPFFQKPAYKLVNTSIRTLTWHGDAMYMFLMTGHFRPEKLYKTKITASYFIGSIAAAFCIVTFYGVYGAIAPSQNYAFSAVSVFSVIVTNIGRFDFISVFLVLFSQVFSIALPLVMATKCLERVFSTKRSIVHAFIVNGIVLTFTAFFSNHVIKVVDFYQKYFVYALIGALTATLLSLVFARERRNDEVFQN